MTVFIGNLHDLTNPTEEVKAKTSSRHLWTFFVKSNRTDIIEEVHIHLHPTFRPNHIICTSPPYSVEGLGWGYFTIDVDVVLKAGFSWVSSDAKDSPNGTPKGSLTLAWTLDFRSFGGMGAMGKHKLKVKYERSSQIRTITK